MPTALVVEDEVASREALLEFVGGKGFEGRGVGTLEEARRALDGEDEVDLVLLDLQLPDGSGLELLPEIEAHAQDVVVLTGQASVHSAVEALRGGVVDYLTKPIELRRLGKILEHVLRTLHLREEMDALRVELRRFGRFGSMVGNSGAMQEVYDLIQRVAPTEATVLISGETGTGKELVAETVHALSRRAKRTFLPLNCGAVPENLIESELFGHERGSFTGAERRRRGVFEQAQGGTLLLDEITEMPLELQVRLLRVLETGRFSRIGGEEELQSDVRVLASTNRDPGKAVADGKLREDLLYRLRVFPISLPPLREREGDVELLAEHFLEKLNAERGSAKMLTAGARERLRRHRWPGNVRELRHVVERAFIVADGAIDESCIALDDVSAGASTTRGPRFEVNVGSSIADVEKRLILATLERLEGNKKEAANVLGISLKTLYNRLNAYAAAEEAASASR